MELLSCSFCCCCSGLGGQTGQLVKPSGNNSMIINEVCCCSGLVGQTVVNWSSLQAINRRVINEVCCCSGLGGQRIVNWSSLQAINRRVINEVCCCSGLGGQRIVNWSSLQAINRRVINEVCCCSGLGGQTVVNWSSLERYEKYQCSFSPAASVAAALAWVARLVIWSSGQPLSALRVIHGALLMLLLLKLLLWPCVVSV